MKRVRFNARSIPLVLAGITVLAYGLLLPMTGFYWDDWPFAWMRRFLGPGEFIPAFRGFRPFLGPIFFLTTSVLPPNPLVWQAFALVVRFLSAGAAWFALSNIWPAHKRQALMVTALFLVFPGYSQQWVALTHVNQEWIPFILYLLSFGFTALALRENSPETICHDLNPTNRNRRDKQDNRFGDRNKYFSVHLSSHLHLARAQVSLVAIVLLIMGLFPTEYFIGLEPLRFLFIWMIVAEGTAGFGARLRESIRQWWPYLLIWLADAAWLAYFYKSGGYVSYDLTAVQAAPSASQAFAAFGDALWKAGAYVWVQIVVLVGRSISAPTSLLTLALIVVTFVLAAFYLIRLELTNGEVRGFAVPAMLIGLVGILLGRVPSFAAGLPLTLQSSFDRFMISMMLGGSLFVAGLVELLIREARLRTVVFAGLIALGIGQQFFNANIFRRDWQRQQEIYWQMAWRMPALTPDTAIITQQMPLDYETDFSMTAALNWMYSPQGRLTSLPYAMVYSEKRLGGIVLPDLKPDMPMRFPYRTLDFRGNTSRTVAIYVPPNGCLRVLDPALDDEQTYNRYPNTVTGPIALSDPSRILIEAPSPALPESPFGKEPAHTWCYVYEKAELARQAHDWKKIVELMRTARAQNLSPQDAFEWLPFIEGAARAGDVQSAEQMTRKAWEQEPKLHRGLCLLLKRLRADGPAEAQSMASGVAGQLSCGQ